MSHIVRMVPYKPASPKNTASSVSPIKKGQLDLSKISKISGAISDRSKGASRAAKLMLALGVEQAAEVLKQLESSEVELLMREMSQIDAIDAQEREELLREFKEFVTEDKAELRGGIKEARKFLEAGLGSDAAEKIMRKINHRDLYMDFAFLEGIEPQALASVLSQEQSQIAAVALSYLNPKTAAEVMRCLPSDFCSEVALRIAKTAKIHPESLQNAARILREKFEKRGQENYSEVGGAQSLAQILNYIGREHESSILNSIEENVPSVVEEVKEHLYTFEELLILSHKEMRLLIARIGDDTLIATALRGLHQDLRMHFFNSMSQNRAADILDEIDRRGPIHIKEIHEARSYILSIARKMDEEGSIRIKKDKEEYL